MTSMPCKKERHSSLSSCHRLVRWARRCATISVKSAPAPPSPITSPASASSDLPAFVLLSHSNLETRLCTRVVCSVFVTTNSNSPHMTILPVMMAWMMTVMMTLHTTIATTLSLLRHLVPHLHRLRPRVRSPHPHLRLLQFHSSRPCPPSRVCPSLLRFPSPRPLFRLLSPRSILRQVSPLFP